MQQQRPGRRGRARTAVFLAVLALLPTLGAGAAHGESSPTPTPGQAERSGGTPAVSTFGVAPADTRKVDGRQAFFYSASPGARLTDHVAVVNSGVTPVTLSVYATDALPSTTGEFALAGPGKPGHDVGAWLLLPHPSVTVTVPARTTFGPSVAIVPVTLRVPTTAGPGDHAGAIVASLASSAVSGSGQRFRLLQRVAARVFVRVSGPLHPSVEIHQLTATYIDRINPLASGRTRLTFVVRNTGNVKLGGAVTVQVKGLLGTTRRITLRQLPLLLPGGAVPQSVVVPRTFPELVMTARVAVDAVAAPGDVDPPRAPAVVTKHFLAIPWTLLGCLLLALLLVALARRLRRRDAPVPAAAPDPLLPTNQTGSRPAVLRRRSLTS